MKQKIRVALIYKKSYNYFQPNHHDKTTYDFFVGALKRDPNLEMMYFPAENRFDASKLKGKCDIILLTNNRTDGTPDELIGIEKLEIPVISRTSDSHYAQLHKQINFHKKWKIDHYFGVIPKSYFYKYYPKEFRFKEIVFGLEPELYQNLKPFNERIKNKILNTGVMGNKSLKSRIANKLLNPGFSGWNLYKLRTLCNDLSYVHHEGMKDGKYPFADNFPKYLSQYRAAIAACTFYPVQKYWEMAAAGCLTFMEMTERNDGSYLGFKDGETSIFMNEKNYKKKFEEFLNDPDNKKWQEIASAGREHVMNNLTNEKAASQLVNLMRELI
jgi:hypothetical protein